MQRKRYRIYVIELSRKVFSEHRRFREANPQFNSALQCLYVGMTSRNPQTRFQQHKNNVKSKKGYRLSSPIVRKYGLYLRPSLYEHLPLMTREEAKHMESKLAWDLRRRRYAVWFN